MYAVDALRLMPVAKITRDGLCAITLLTAVLWGFIFVERLTVSQARADADRAIREIRALQFRKHATPVAAPVFRPPVQRPVIG